MTDIDLDTARWLKEQGYPQDASGLVYFAQDGHLDGFFPTLGALTDKWTLSVRDPHREARQREHACVWVAAPHPLDALEWLEKSAGVYFGRTCIAEMGGEPRWCAHFGSGLQGVKHATAGTAVELLRAIRAQMGRGG